MKHILIIGSLSSESSEAKAQFDMQTFVGQAVEAGGTEVTASACFLDEVGYVIEGQSVAVLDMKNGRDLKDYDLVFFRGKLAASINIASTVAQYLDIHKVPHVNTAYSKRRAIGKISQMFQLHALNLPVPKTVSASAKYLPELIAQHLTYPMIVKDVQGAHGNNNFLVRSAESLGKILLDHPHLTFMAQEFIENDGDYRVLLVGNEVTIIHRKGEDGSHLNNTSVGGKATLIEANDLPAEIIAQSRKFAEFCGYEIAGVDVIVDSVTGKHYFLEINSQPQLASGAFVAHKAEMLANYFATLLN